MRRKLKWIDVWALCTSALVVGGAVFTLLLLDSLTAHSQGAAASQPASQPAIVSGGAWAWIKANAWWLVPLTINVLSSIATALKDYPKAGGFTKVLWTIIALLGNVEFKDGKRPGLVFKAPFMPPAPPPAAAAPTATPAPDADKPKE